MAYGWTALRPILLDDGFLVHSAEREANLELVGTLGIAANALCKLPLGFVLDGKGPRFTAAAGGVFLVVGALLMAFGSRELVWHAGLGYFLIGTAGPFIQMPCFQFCKLFGEKEKSAMAVLVTCFELSTGVFDVCKFLHDRLRIDATVLFVAMAVVGGLVVASALAFWPDSPSVSPAACRSQPLRAGGVAPAPVFAQLRTRAFAYGACFLVVQIFRQGFIIDTVGLRNEVLFDAGTAAFLSDSFSLILPLGFIPMALLTAVGATGALLARPRLAFIAVNFASAVYGLLLVAPLKESFLAAYVIFPVVRQMVFSLFFSFVSDAFGFASFGRLNGVASVMVGSLQLFQAPLIRWMSEAPAPDSAGRWLSVDLLFALLPLALVASPAIWPHTVTAAREQPRLPMSVSLEPVASP